MKVSVNLFVSDKEFYPILIHSLEEEIFQATGNKMKAHEGFEFKKILKRYTSKKPVDAICKVERLDENKCYEVSLITAVEVTTVRFDITKIGENQITVEYEETSKSVSGNRVGANHKVVGAVLGFFYLKRRMKRKLRRIEEYVAINRG